VITADMKMAELVLMDIQLLAVIQRLNIPLGFREKTVREVCHENDVDVNFFIQLANAFHDKEYFPRDQFITFPAKWIVGYLQNSHRCYVDHRIPSIEKLIIELEADLEQPTNSKLLLNFFNEYINEFNSHIELEERVVFPYVLELEKSLQQQKPTPEYAQKFNAYQIDHYVSEHNDIEEKLYDLKNILIKYMPPPAQNCRYNTLILELFRLEKDLHDHSDLEDKVLIPKVKQMESELKKW
jgi:regulator of cell morphogenesis and NO signaling